MATSVRTREPVTETPATNAHHELPVHEVVLLLNTDADGGLDAGEAAQRLERFGPNTLPPLARHGPLVRFLLQFNHPLIYVLLASAAATALLGETVDAGVIMGVVLLNALIGFVQESRAEHALDALVAMVDTSATVIRNGNKQRISSGHVVPGDLVLLESGDKVPADARLLASRDMQVDESALTGESLPAAKEALEMPVGTALPDRRNMAYSGTLVTHGQGAGLVVATGADTEIGLIHRLVEDAGGVQTPLTRKIARFSRILTVAILALAAATFLIGLARGEPAADMLTAAVALAVGAIPEGLPAVVTITLAMGVARMARRNAIVRKLPAVETLGSTTVICTDKTGTLTENQMTVTTIVTVSGSYEVTGTGYAPVGAIIPSHTTMSVAPDVALDECLLAGVLCNDSRVVAGDGRWEVVGDPTEAALVVSAAKGGFERDHAHAEHPRVDALPFESERQYMATLHRCAPGEPGTVYVKGAVERLVALCTRQLTSDGRVEAVDAATILACADQQAARGLRVLALARADVQPEITHLTDEALGQLGLCFVGMQAMHDPPRLEVIAAVASCHAAGIDVKMITGDHAATARAIAEEIGLHGPGDGAPRVMTGTELAACDDAGLSDAAEETTVFARVSPEQKLRLVRALQRRGHVVAMTGDGVNDAPALKQADIGVAMGRAGTEVAKESADMVLTDDNFASIEAAVEEGRGVFDNLTKFIVWTLPTNVGEGLVILAAIVAGTVLPMLPVQVLWVNMTTAVILGLTLAFEPKEPGIMTRRPGNPSRPLLTRELGMRLLLVSGILLVSTFGLFQWEQARGVPLAEARTVAVNVFVLVEITYLFNCRSLERSILQVGLFTNRWVWMGAATMVALQLAFTYLPTMNGLFHTAPIDGAAWARAAAVALAGYGIVGTEKWIRRRLRGHETVTR